MICSSCDQVISNLNAINFNKRAPAHDRKYFCSRKCFYIDYIQRGPKSPVDHNLIWPVFELEGLPFDDRVTLMCCYDEISHILARHYEDVAVSRLMSTLLSKYNIPHLEYCLIILMIVLFDHKRLLKIVGIPF
jgi:hypothetical protein